MSVGYHNQRPLFSIRLQFDMSQKFLALWTRSSARTIRSMACEITLPQTTFNAICLVGSFVLELRDTRW